MSSILPVASWLALAVGVAAAVTAARTFYLARAANVRRRVVMPTRASDAVVAHLVKLDAHLEQIRASVGEADRQAKQIIAEATASQGDVSALTGPAR